MLVYSSFCLTWHRHFDLFWLLDLVSPNFESLLFAFITLPFIAEIATILYVLYFSVYWKYSRICPNRTLCATLKWSWKFIFAVWSCFDLFLYHLRLPLPYKIWVFVLQTSDYTTYYLKKNSVYITPKKTYISLEKREIKYKPMDT